MKLKIDKKDCLREDIKIPKGYRVIEDYECCKEKRTNKRLFNLLKKGYVWVNTPNGIRAADLSYCDVGFHVYGSYILDDRCRSSGVFVKIEK